MRIMYDSYKLNPKTDKGLYMFMVDAFKEAEQYPDLPSMNKRGYTIREEFFSGDTVNLHLVHVGEDGKMFGSPVPIAEINVEVLNHTVNQLYIILQDLVVSTKALTEYDRSLQKSAKEIAQEIQKESK